jgi:hypothetical protein
MAARLGGMRRAVALVVAKVTALDFLLLLLRVLGATFESRDHTCEPPARHVTSLHLFCLFLFFNAADLVHIVLRLTARQPHGR